MKNEEILSDFSTWLIINDKEELDQDKAKVSLSCIDISHVDSTKSLSFLYYQFSVDSSSLLCLDSNVLFDMFLVELLDFCGKPSEGTETESPEKVITDVMKEVNKSITPFTGFGFLAKDICDLVDQKEALEILKELVAKLPDFQKIDSKSSVELLAWSVFGKYKEREKVTCAELILAYNVVLKPFTNVPYTSANMVHASNIVNKQDLNRGIIFSNLVNYSKKGTPKTFEGFVDYVLENKEEEPEAPSYTIDIDKIVEDVTFSVNKKFNQTVEKGAKSLEKKTEKAKKEVDAYISECLKKISPDIQLRINGVKADVQGIVHDKFEQVLQFVHADEPIFLTGPAGSGKNHLCKDVAKALKLDFYFTNAVTQEYKITGFTDAMGNYQESQFYKAFKNGGLFMLDEMDASIPEVLVILNAAIANRYFDFPAPIGYVEAHEDFRIISAGNTFGQGADYEYVGRNQLDAASLDRFALVPIDYDERVDLMMSQNNEELCSFCRDFRTHCASNGIKHVVSYRAISRLAKMEQVIPLKDAIETCLIKGMCEDDKNIIKKAFGKSSNKYVKCFCKG